MKTALTTLSLATLAVMAPAQTARTEPIRIGTDNIDLILKVGDNGRLYQTYLGPRLLHASDAANLDWAVVAGSDGSLSRRGWEAYGTSGSEDFFEPALSVTHADGNAATYLYFRGVETTPVDGGTHTRIALADDKYPLSVTLHYVAYDSEDVIKTWTEISHKEKRPVTLSRYASAMLYFRSGAYWLTEFASDWAREAQMQSQRLQFGKKIVDTKLGSRAAMVAQPFFELGLGAPVEEGRGDVLMGTIGWNGNFRFTFEVDNAGNLRVLPSINPHASAYDLRPGETFATPEFIFTLSSRGTSAGSRNLHDWARRHQVKDGMGRRLTLLNNWENTAFDFDEAKLAGLMREAKDLGVDMFLLDDGWFGNKHPRNADNAGLGDWDANRDKLPGGIGALVKAADDAGVRFGIWIEPEMVNPRSELYEKHPDWVIENPNRETYYYRNQLVLDLSNPRVQDYVFGVVDKIVSENPGVAYFKWDCNSPITNVFSPYAADKQGRLYIDHVRGVVNVFARVRDKYPHLPMMLCSGGGGRCDYESLKYFTEFWPSDNTDPVDRIFIQWGFSQFFPAKVLSAHVTSWNRSASVKFRTDVASMGKLGFDIGLHELSPDELSFCRQSVETWREMQPAIMEGDLYRLVSPYDGNHSAVCYAAKDSAAAVLFAFDIFPRFKEPLLPVRLEGLDAERLYRVEEVNLMPGQAPTLKAHGKVLSGDYLMKVGLDVFTADRLVSHVVRLTAQ